MNRPASIVTFERCYLGALVVGLIGTILTWRQINDLISVRQAGAMIGTWYLPTMTVIGYLIPLLLWYFVARRASVVAKWIVVIFYVIGVLGILSQVIQHSFISGLSLIVSVIAVVLNTIAVISLFRPDAKAWLGARNSPSIEQL